MCACVCVRARVCVCVLFLWHRRSLLFQYFFFFPSFFFTYLLLLLLLLLLFNRKRFTHTLHSHDSLTLFLLLRLSCRVVSCRVVPIVWDFWWFVFFAPLAVIHFFIDDVYSLILILLVVLSFATSKCVPPPLECLEWVLSASSHTQNLYFHSCRIRALAAYASWWAWHAKQRGPVLPPPPPPPPPPPSFCVGGGGGGGGGGG